MVIKMRVFYLYQINELCQDLYEKYPYRLYHILKDVYYTSKYNQPIAISSYDQITEKFNKVFIDNFINNEYRLKLYYHNTNHIHIISNTNEYSTLMVSRYSLKLKTNLNYSSFFKTINDYNEKIFVCDFQNSDYFWLNRIVNNDKNKIK